MSSGIVSYGAALPRCRIKSPEILKVWNNTQDFMIKRLGYEERAVLYPDQDTITLAIDAGEQALERANISRDQIGAVLLGTGTSPYQTKAAVTVVADALGLPKDIFSFDLQFAGKSGTSAIITAKALVDSGQVDYALAIGADTINRHVSPGHLWEYGASAGAVAFLIGNENIIATIEGSASHAQDQSDYFRLEGERFIQVGSGFIGYVSGWGVSDNCTPAAQALFEKLDMTPDDFEACALHQQSFVTPMFISGPLKLNVKETVINYILTPRIGDLGAASSLLALAYILDEGGEDRNILVLGYGYGAGADAIAIKTTDLLDDALDDFEGQVFIDDLLDDKFFVDYGTALKYEYKLQRSEMLGGVL
jgi:hydroxymethylglutaryl-CoA synthase